MSIYAVFDESEPTFLASNQGWGDVVAWAEQLSPEEFPAIVQLAEHGFANECRPLLAELSKATESVKPEELVQSTLAEFSQLLEGREEMSLVITDGIGEESDSAAKETGNE